jgi:hypothetical protein
MESEDNAHPFRSDSIVPFGFRQAHRTGNAVMRAATVMLAILGLANLVSVGVLAQANGFVVDRENRTIVVEPYGPNIVRITLSSEKPAALAAPGYGITGSPSMTGWTQTQDSDGYDVIRSAGPVDTSPYAARRVE